MIRGILGLTTLLALGAFVACDAAMYMGDDPIKFVNSGQSQDQPKGSELQGTKLSLDACQFDDPTAAPVSGACVFDAYSKTYRQGDTEIVVPNVSHFGVAFLFAPGYVPNPSDISLNSSEASVEVFAAPDSGADTPTLNKRSAYVRAHAELTAEGALILEVLDPIPDAYYVTVDLHMGGLYRSRVSPTEGGPCSLPDQWLCAEGGQSGYRTRFLVRGAPAATKPAPDGSCLLSYNTALVASGSDDCCYRQGQPNQCDSNIQCNELSGAGCCLVYATENTVSGQRCCLYENGELGDGALECQQLLSTAPTAPVTAPQGACLLSYNTALVAAGADACCHRQGGRNLCDKGIQCNSLSGAGCCLLYGTEHTAGGPRCCLYEDGELGDSAAECLELIGMP